MYFMKLRLPVFIVLSAASSACLLSGADLSIYRNFHLGMSVAEVASQPGVQPGEAKLLSSRPEHVEEIDWHINRPSSTARRDDPVQEIRFSFFNGTLFEMTVTYDPDRTAGLTDADMVEALTAIYGLAARGNAPEVNFVSSGYTKSVKARSRWEDARDQVSLVKLPYNEGFGLVVLSKRTFAQSETAMLESDRLDRVEAPQRQLEIEAKRSAEAQVKDDKARIANKPGFQP
jgi:hypothetical protein